MTALRIPQFRRLWLASLISETGDWMILISLPVLIYERTGSTAGTSGAFLIELIAGVLVAPLAGRLADRVNRKRLMTTILVIQAAILLPLLWVTNLAVIYAIIGAMAGLTAMFAPVKNALLPTLVPEERLVSANALTGLGQNLSRLVGASLGGALYSFAGLTVTVAVDTASFLVAVVLIAGVAVPRPIRSDDATASERGRPFTRRRVWAPLAVITVTAIGQGLFVVLFVVFVIRELHGGGAETGLLRAVQAIGAIAGGVLIARMTSVHPGKLSGFSSLVFGVIALITWNLTPISTAVPVYALLFVAFGVPAAAIVTGLTTTLHQATVDGERGAVFAAFGAAFTVGQGLGIILAGSLGDTLGVVPLLNVQAALYLVGGVCTLVLLRGRVTAAESETEQELATVQ